MRTCGFCQTEIPEGAVLCKGCGAYKLRTSYKRDKLLLASLGGALLPIGAAAACYVWMMQWPKILYGLASITALLGLYFIFAARKILKQWDYWHRR